MREERREEKRRAAANSIPTKSSRANFKLQTHRSPSPPQNVAKVPVLGCLVTCWDLGGQVSFRVIWEQYYKEAQCIIFVVDSCDDERIAEAATTFEALMAHPDLVGIPVLVLANKQDKDGARSVDALCGKGMGRRGTRRGSIPRDRRGPEVGETVQSVRRQRAQGRRHRAGDAVAHLGRKGGGAKGRVGRRVLVIDTVRKRSASSATQLQGWCSFRFLLLLLLVLVSLQASAAPLTPRWTCPRGRQQRWRRHLLASSSCSSAHSS